MQKRARTLFLLTSGLALVAGIGAVALIISGRPIVAAIWAAFAAINGRLALTNRKMMTG